MPLFSRIVQIFPHSWKAVVLFLTKMVIFFTFLTPVIFTNQSFFPTLPPQTIYFRLLVEISFGLYLLLLVHSRAYLPRLSPIFTAVAFFIGALTITSLLGIHPEKSFWGTLNRMEGLIAFLHYGLFFLVLGGVFKSMQDWIRVFWAVLLVSIPVGAIGLSEYFGLTILLPITEWGRMEATMGNPAFYGAYLLFVIFLATFLTFWGKNTLWKTFAWSLVFMNGSFLLMTGTRAAWIGMAGGILFFIIAWLALYRNKMDVPRQNVLAALSVFLGIFFVFTTLLYFHIIPSNPFWERYQNLWTEASSLQTQRLVFWPTAIKAWQESPLFGYGLESFPYAYEKFYNASFLKNTPELEFYDRAHNIFLELLVTSGILGLLSYLVLIASAFWTFWKIYRFTNSILPFVLCALLLAYLIQNIFSFDTTISYSLLFLILAFAHVWYCRITGQEKPKNTSAFALTIPHIALGSILISVGAFVYIANMGTWQATATLAQGYHLRYENPLSATESFSHACTHGSFPIRMDACALGIQLMLNVPFKLYGQTKQPFLTTLDQNLTYLHSMSKDYPSIFQIKHAILLAQGYETLYKETLNSAYLIQEEEILLNAQKHNPNILPIYRLAESMYASTQETQKAKQFFKKAPPEIKTLLNK